jgi:predicted small integral membrane protein
MTMPYVELSRLSDDAKAWIFGADRPLAEPEKEAVRREVPSFLTQWTAHGAPVPASFDLVEDRFLVIAADEDAAPGGCSIDSLFRFIRALGDHLELDLLGSATVWYRDSSSEIREAPRTELAELARREEITRSTPIFDTSIDRLGSFRDSFEQPAAQSWAATLLSSSPAR